jgi:hypothetical protein
VIINPEEDQQEQNYVNGKGVYTADDQVVKKEKDKKRCMEAI